MKLHSGQRPMGGACLTLLGRILSDFERCGVVGEETNKLVGYLAAVSRKLEEPLAALIQSSSAAGKTALMEAVLAFVPEEDKTKYSAMTGQSLFYMGDADLKHKVLAVVEEEGASRASYALKLLQSEGELTIASTGKDPATGRLVTHEYRVEGPTQLFLHHLGAGRGAAQPLHRPHRRRGAAADAGHPPASTREADAGRPSGPARERRC